MTLQYYHHMNQCKIPFHWGKCHETSEEKDLRKTVDSGLMVNKKNMVPVNNDLKTRIP